VTDTPPAYLPPDLADQLATELPDSVDTATRWAIERLAEAAYARGCADGHRRGHRFGLDQSEREAAAQIGMVSALLETRPNGRKSPRPHPVEAAEAAPAEIEGAGQS
jgi:flagellar biosynthesis/type III secretory pathway protein FliH